MNEANRTRGLSPILETVARYYSDKLERFGATARGVDWNSAESQRLRFDQLLRIDATPAGRSVNDYGCGYGAFLDYLVECGRSWRYAGFDVSEAMVARARALHADGAAATFTTSAADMAASDYTVASGIFNVRLEHSQPAWEEYVLEVLADMDRLSLSGFAFNMLSTYSDQERRRPGLFYGDPALYFDYCKRRFSPRIALLHDYPLYEFTIIVRK